MSDDEKALQSRIIGLIVQSYENNAEDWSVTATQVTLAGLEKCESPIEKLMGAALSYAFGQDFLFYVGPASAFFEPTRDYLRIEPQREIGKYRVDFAITARSWWSDDLMVESKVVVECDGHAFHEKTPEQAKRDKERDRFLASNGWTVLRFTGSEINFDPMSCAAGVAEFVRGDFRRLGAMQMQASNG